MKNLDPYACSTAIRRADDAPVDSTPSGLALQIIAQRRFLLARAFLLTQNASAADDLVQDTLERALTARITFRPGTNLKAWLSVILKRRFIDGRRHAMAAQRLRLQLEWSPVESHPIEEADPVELLGVDDVVQILGDLSAPDREIFDLFYLRRLSYRQIADRLGVRLSTVGTRLLRSKRRVRTKLEGTMERKRAAFGTSVEAACPGATGS